MITMVINMTDEEFMREAIALAREAAAEGEVPVGCVVVDGETIVGRGRNRRERAKNALSPAELDECFELSYHYKHVDEVFKRLGLEK